ncbi:MAG: hypothetical protein Q9191_005879 [Dirinaria sp. TL-2023a]
MSSSGLSELSSPLSTDEELANAPIRPGSLEHYFKTTAAAAAKQASPPAKKKRPPSPPHEYVLADNADIAFIVMFRSRFSDAFPKSLPHYGPQDIERGVVETLPGDHVERLLCAIIGLVLNRKKDVEKGHYQRALEEALQTHAAQWPSAWQGKNPLHGGGNFNNMSPAERLTLLKALVIWSLSSSDAVQSIIKESYKQQRHEDDLNQPLSVQAWGRDGDKRRFWLIEGQDDTHFRLYRESNPFLKHNTWRSVAGTIDELKEVASKLDEEGTQAARRLRDRITAGIPRFEASEDKRKRRDYRLARKAQFTRPEPGFSLYEGRTRGKRMRYTFSDEDEGDSDPMHAKRSNRHSGISTPAEPAGPIFTASGRQVRSRVGGAYGQSLLNGQQGNDTLPAEEGAEGDPSGEGQQYPDHRPQRSGLRNGVDRSARRSHTKSYKSYDGIGDDGDDSDAQSSGEEWDGGDEEDDVEEDQIPDDDDDDDDDEDLDMSDDGTGTTKALNHWADDKQRQSSLVVSLRYHRKPSPLPPGEVSGVQNLPNPDKAPAQTSPIDPTIPNQQTQSQRLLHAFQNATPHQPDEKPLQEPLKSPFGENTVVTQELPSVPDRPAYDKPMPDAV